MGKISLSNEIAKINLPGDSFIVAFPLHLGRSVLDRGERKKQEEETSSDLHEFKLVDERDGQSYDYIQLGELFWMKENLNFQAPQSECYNADKKNCDKYGRLYSYTDSRTACPDKWQLPSPKDWKSLKKLMKSGKADKIVSEGEWEPEAFQEANDELGLSILPGGRKDEKGPANQENEFGEMGISTSYWLDHGEYHWHIRWGKSHIHKHGDISKQGRKFYIRCVRAAE